MNDVRLTRLLRPVGGEMKEVSRLHPVSVSVTLNIEPLSAADVVLTENDAVVRVHDFMEIFGQNGSLGIYRVESVQTTYTKDRKVHLNHAIDVLNDAVMAGSGKITGTVADVLAGVMATQTQMLGNTPFWRLGTCEDVVDYEIEYDHGNALECLKGIAEDQNDYYFSFDFSTFPWTMNFLAKNDTVLTEFRMSRNVENCRVTLDDSELCTRLYLAVDDGDPVMYDNPTAQGEWGVVAKTEAVNSEDVQDVAAWVTDYLVRNSSPRLQISIDGEELNRITGESLDEAHIGRICRVALVDYGVIFQERIVSVEYPNIIRTPEKVSLSLANKPPNMSSSFSSVFRRVDVTQKSLSKASYKWEATDEHVTDLGTILHLAGLEIDPHGVWAYASEHAEEYALGATFTAQASAIQSEVTRASEAEGSLSSRITQTATAVESKVSAGDIASTINQTAQAVLIQASKINLSGYVTVDDLEATNATIRNLMSGLAQAQILSAGSLIGNRLVVNGGMEIGGAATAWHVINWNMDGLASGSFLGLHDMGLGHYHTFTASEDNGIVTLTLGAPTSTAPSPQTFDIASTTYYQNAVAEAYQRGLIDGGSSVVLDSIWIDTVGDPSFNAQGVLMQTIRAQAYVRASGDPEPFGSPVEVQRNVMSAYNMGSSDGYTTGYAAGVASVTQRSITGDYSPYPITLFSDEIGASVPKSITVDYDDGDDDMLSLTIDATRPYAAGQESVTLNGYWSGRHYTVEASNGETQSSGNLSFSGSWGSGDAANIYSFSVNDGSTTIFSDAINATNRYNAGRTSVTLSGSWDAATGTYTVTATNGETESTTLTRVPITPIGSPESITKIGTAVTWYDYTNTPIEIATGSGYYVPLSIQRHDVTLQGNRCTTTLYRESGGNYYRYDVPLYFGGSSRTLYSTSGSWKTLYEKKTLNYNIRDEESMDTCYRAGSTVTRYTAGTQRTDLFALPA